MLKFIKAQTANELYAGSLTDLFYDRSFVSPRGMQTIEITPFAMELAKPIFNIIDHPKRNASKAFMAAELLWILLGRDDVEMVQFYNSQMAQYSDDGKILAGAYGPRIMPQFKYVYDTLKADPFSRQAVITAWKPLPSKSKDIPCTVMLHFIRRGPYLHLYTYMRSNDAWLGFPYDLHNFTCLQIIMASLLGCHVGSYYHFVGSYHLYAEHLNKVADLIDIEPPYVTINNIATRDPNITNWEDFQSILYLVHDLEERIRANDPVIMNAESPNYYMTCPFFQQKLEWLIEKSRSKHANTNNRIA